MLQREFRDLSSFTEEERERQDSDRRNALLLLGQNRKLNHLPPDRVLAKSKPDEVAPA